MTIYLAHRRPGGQPVPNKETMLPSGSSGQPGDESDPRTPPIRPCSKWGLTVAASPQTTGRSYRPISTLPPVQIPFPQLAQLSDRKTGGGVFLCHFPSPTASLLTPQKPGGYPALCPLEPGLSSPPKTRGGGHPVCRLPPRRTLAHGLNGVNGICVRTTWWQEWGDFWPGAENAAAG